MWSLIILWTAAISLWYGIWVAGTMYSFPNPASVRRFVLIRTPWFRVFLHNIIACDPGRDLHNHPWPFLLTLILRGGYEERQRVGRRFYGPGWKNGAKRWNRLTPDAYHRIDRVLPGTWTLVFAGRKSRKWGFLVNGTTHVDYSGPELRD